MRIKRAVAGRRGLPAATGALFLIVAASAAGCSGSSSSISSASGGTGSGYSAASGAAAAPEAGSTSAAAGGVSGGPAARGPAGGSAAADAARLAAGAQRLIYTAQLSVRAASVQAAVSRATSIVNAAGGYVAEEKATTPPDGHGQAGAAGQASATVMLKIPAAAYQATLAQLSGGGLGTRLSLEQQAQDVTQQVADTNSRVASDQAAIAQLRALLKKAGSVSELLSVQNQIDQQESDLESMLAQQRTLDHETSYATVTLSLTGPKAAAAKPRAAAPPPGLASGASSGWHAFAVTVGWVLTALGAIAPFTAALAVIGGACWWLRRRGSRARQRPSA